ncbi:MAG: MFS transporter [Thermomicrobiales bacterium]|nr:MFS transporter [Thermomicrobiales bacterium]
MSGPERPGDTQLVFSRNVPRFYWYTALTEFQLWAPVWVLYFTREGMSLQQIGSLELVAIVLLAAAEAPTGIVADVWGRKASLAIGAGVQVVALLCLLASVLSPVFLFGYLIWGVSFSFISGASDAFVYDSLQADHDTERFTHVASRYAVIAQAAGGAAAVAGSLVALWDMRACFLLTAVATAAGLGVALTFREPPLSTADEQHSGFHDTLRTGARLVLRDVQVRPILLIGSIFGLFATLAWMTMLQPYAMSVQAPVWIFGGLLLMSRLCRMGGAFLAPRLAARVPRLRLLATAAGVMVAALFGLWLAASWPALALLGVLSAASAAVLPVLSAMLNDAIPSAQRATIISLQSLVTMLGLAAVQWSFFALSERVSAPFAAGFCGLLLVLMATPVLLALRRSHPVRIETGVVVTQSGV